MLRRLEMIVADNEEDEAVWRSREGECGTEDAGELQHRGLMETRLKKLWKLRVEINDIAIGLRPISGASMDF